MFYKKIICIYFIIIFCSVGLFAQSRNLEEGVSGTGFYFNSIIEDSDLSTIGFSAAYSIGGIMDFGVGLSTESGTIDNNESTDLDFSLLYNMIIIKQNSVQPLNVQLEGSYGYVNTTSDYLDYYNRDRTGQGFKLGVLIFHNFLSSNILSFTVGGEINYSNYLVTTTDYSDPDDPETVSYVRNESIKYGGLAGISLQPELWPILNIELQVMYNDSSEQLEYSPTISVVNPLY